MTDQELHKEYVLVFYVDITKDEQILDELIISVDPCEGDLDLCMMEVASARNASKEEYVNYFSKNEIDEKKYPNIKLREYSICMREPETNNSISTLMKKAKELVYDTEIITTISIEEKIDNPKKEEYELLEKHFWPSKKNK